LAGTGRLQAYALVQFFLAGAIWRQCKRSWRQIDVPTDCGLDALLIGSILALQSFFLAILSLMVPALATS
jgi:hypothetical protein